MGRAPAKAKEHLADMIFTPYAFRLDKPCCGVFGKKGHQNDGSTASIRNPFAKGASMGIFYQTAIGYPHPGNHPSSYLGSVPVYLPRLQLPLPLHRLYLSASPFVKYFGLLVYTRQSVGRDVVKRIGWGYKMPLPISLIQLVVNGVKIDTC